MCIVKIQRKLFTRLFIGTLVVALTNTIDNEITGVVTAVISDHSNYFNEWGSTRDADRFPNWPTGSLEIVGL